MSAIEDSDIVSRVNAWKTEMRKLFHVPDEYDILMNYGKNNDIEAWINHCSETDTIVIKNMKTGRYFILAGDGSMSSLIDEHEYYQILSSGYKRSDDGCEMSQMESDCIAHFLQITDVVSQSSWRKTKSVYQANMNRDGLERANMPNLEQTVFALLYLRQLIGNKGNDDLFHSACRYYIDHAVQKRKTAFIKKKLEEWDYLLKEKPMFFDLSQDIVSNQELLEIFQYGSFIIHSPERTKSFRACNLFRRICTGPGRVVSLLNLNILMRNLFALASSVAELIREDFGLWIQEKKVPKPDLFWQQNVFQWEPLVEKSDEPDNQPPQFDWAFNIVISEK